MIESTLLSLVEKYLEVRNEITYEPLSLKTTIYFRNKVAFEHVLDMSDMEEYLVERTLERVNVGLEKEDK